MSLILSLPVSYQQPTSPYITHKNKTYSNEKMIIQLIKQSKLLKIKSNILSKLFKKKYGLQLGEFNNTHEICIFSSPVNNNSEIITLPLIELAKVLQVTSSNPLISR